MSQEIVYTSASQGLKKGSRGFCTVVSTVGMASNLAQRLESLSGYRHQYMPHEADAHLNPINFQHVIVTVGGRKHSVLSRICDAGFDYTQRSNKLAHHIALDPSERTVGGPAWALNSNGFCLTQWDGKTRTLPKGRLPPDEDCSRDVCHEWAKLAGDAGWAGVLANSVVKKGRPISIIYKPGTDLLPLVMEAVSLLPPEKRWEATFSTYFTKLPAGVDCQWRFVLDGTPEAKSLKMNPHSMPIDLTAPVQKAEGGELVETARSGNFPKVETPRQTPRSRAPISTDAWRKPSQSQPEFDPLSSPSLKGIRPLAEPPIVGNTRSIIMDKLPRRWMPVAFGIVAVLFFGVAISVAFIVGKQSKFEIVQKDDKQSQLPIDKGPKLLDPQPTAVDKKKADPLALLPKEMLLPVDKPEKLKRPMEESPATKKVVPPPPKKTSKVKPDKPVPIKNPFVDIRAKNRRLSLPRKSLSVSRKSTAAKEIAKLFVADPKRCQLEIVPTPIAFKQKGLTVEVELDDSQGNSRTWKVISKNSKSKTDRGSVIGTFTLKDQTLAFSWPSRSRSAPQVLLERCFLNIQVDDMKIRCALSSPKKIKPIKLDFEQESFTVKIPSIDPRMFSSNMPLLLDIRLEGFPANPKVSETVKLKLGDTVKIEVPRSGQKGEFFELGLEFQGGNICVLNIDNLAWPEIFEEKKKINKKRRKAFTRDILFDLRDECKPNSKNIIGLNREIKKKNNNLKEHHDNIEKMNKAIEGLKDQLAELPSKPPANSPMFKPWLQQKNGMNRRVREIDTVRKDEEKKKKKLKDQISVLDRKVVYYDETLDWCNDLAKMIDLLENRGRIHLRLYTMFENEPIDLVASE